tara:strand:- start:214 stop:411 length:198 start_codon:yes stop_codon:yes gene_type:complete
VLTTKDSVSRVRRGLMIAGDIKITEIEDNEDGSARVTLDMDAETYHDIFEYGFIQLIKKGMDLDD